MRRKALLFFGICIALSGCSQNNLAQSLEESTVDCMIKEEIETGYDIFSEEETAPEKFFQVLVDKSALETGRENQTTVIIVTNVTDWEYSAKADYGKIVNLQEESFDYVRPKDEKQYEDTLTVWLTNKETMRVHEYTIPLTFPIPQDAIKELLKEMEECMETDIILPPEEIQVQEAAEGGNGNVIEAHEFIPYEEQ